MPVPEKHLSLKLNGLKKMTPHSRRAHSNRCSSGFAVRLVWANWKQVVLLYWFVHDFLLLTQMKAWNKTKQNKKKPFQVCKHQELGQTIAKLLSKNCVHKNGSALFLVKSSYTTAGWLWNEENGFKNRKKKKGLKRLSVTLFPILFQCWSYVKHVTRVRWF